MGESYRFILDNCHIPVEEFITKVVVESAL